MIRSSRSLTVLVFTVALIAASCGGSDDDSGGGTTTAASSSTSNATASVTPADATACLDAAGWPVETSTLLSAEQMDAFGIDEVLGWSFADTGFLGSITFYDDENTAREQHVLYAEAAEAAEAAGLNIAERFGVAVVDITGGNQEAVDAARSCLTP